MNLFPYLIHTLMCIEFCYTSCNIVVGFTLEHQPIDIHHNHLSPPMTMTQSSSSSFEMSAMNWLQQNGGMSPIVSSQILVSSSSSAESSSSTWRDQLKNTKQYKKDIVKRVVDASTIQLEKSGYISLESVRGVGSTYTLPDCFDKAPSYKLKQLLKKGTVIRLVNLEEIMNNNNDIDTTISKSSSSSSSTPRLWIIRDSDNLLVNEELIRSGFALVRKGSKTTPSYIINDLSKLEKLSKERGRGIYTSCADPERVEDDISGSSIQTANFVAEFEELDTVETEYKDDGGKVVVRRREKTPTKPSNPGDIKGCSDFDNYEESLKWYETYFPYYGDVAKLDRNFDGVPCPGLPHTSVAEKYRMKVPNNNIIDSK